MKPILSTLIFLLVLFLSFFFFSFLRPSPALAGECCTGGTPIDDKFCDFAGGKATNNCNSATEKCNVSTNVCIPKNQVQTKPPTCGPKPDSIDIKAFGEFPAECWRHDDGSNNFGQYVYQCCKGAKEGVGYYCEDKNQPGYVIDGCSNIKNNAIFVAKDDCGGDPIWKYDDKTGKCVQFAESKWALNFSPCTGGEGISTAVGCIPTNGPDGLKGFLEFVLKWAFFASGGIIVLMVIATGYTLLTSQGNPEKLQAAKENIVALFSGLILIAFSLVLLQTIGADILKLPTF